MEIIKKITVTLTPDEVEKIVIKYLRDNNKIDIENISYNLERKYYDHTDQHGSYEVTSISCYGTIGNKNDNR